MKSSAVLVFPTLFWLDKEKEVLSFALSCNKLLTLQQRVWRINKLQTSVGTDINWKQKFLKRNIAYHCRYVCFVFDLIMRKLKVHPEPKLYASLMILKGGKKKIGGFDNGVCNFFVWAVPILFTMYLSF